MADAGPDASGTTGDNPTPGGAGSGDGSTPGSQSTGAERTYTQEQVDRQVAEVRRREAAKFGDYDTVKSRLAEMEAAGQSELERAQALAKDADAKAADALRQRDTLLVRSAVTASAARAGAVDPDVVVALLADTIKVGADGAIDGDVDALVGQLLEEKSYLRNGAAGPAKIGSADQGAHSARPASTPTPSKAMDNLFRSAPGR